MWQNLKNLFWHLPKSIFWNLFYGFPGRKLKLIGITGTDGKTTTCFLLYHILKNAGYRVGYITTVGARFGDTILDTGFHTTSPEPSLLQKLLAQMLSHQTEYVVCEVTSHSLDQYRFWGCHFLVSGITNISHEHLDYHHQLNQYILSKSKLFSLSDFAVLNRDDLSYRTIQPTLSTPYSTYSLKAKSDFRARNIKNNHRQLRFKVNSLKLASDSNYLYQAYNILLSLAIVSHLKINPQFLIDTIKNFPEVPGRRQVIDNPFGLITIIDFAHTPAALSATLSSLKKSYPASKLIVIFGATGGRDKTKRPIMGKVVSTLADTAIITADDTRNENISDINQQIISGIKPPKSAKFTYFNIPNRQDAFNLAIKIAKKTDIVIACGKGHEKTILHGKTEYPWSEAEAFRTAFKLRLSQS